MRQTASPQCLRDRERGVRARVRETRLGTRTDGAGAHAPRCEEGGFRRRGGGREVQCPGAALGFLFSRCTHQGTGAAAAASAWPGMAPAACSSPASARSNVAPKVAIVIHNVGSGAPPSTPA